MRISVALCGFRSGLRDECSLFTGVPAYYLPNRRRLSCSGPRHPDASCGGTTNLTKRIGLLTSGGDCGGLNAVIRAVAMRAHSAYGWEVLGIRNGSMGLLRHPPHAEN